MLEGAAAARGRRAGLRGGVWAAAQPQSSPWRRGGGGGGGVSMASAPRSELAAAWWGGAGRRRPWSRGGPRGPGRDARRGELGCSNPSVRIRLARQIFHSHGAALEPDWRGRGPACMRDGGWMQCTQRLLKHKHGDIRTRRLLQHKHFATPDTAAAATQTRSNTRHRGPATQTRLHQTRYLVCCPPE